MTRRACPYCAAEVRPESTYGCCAHCGGFYVVDEVEQREPRGLAEAALGIPLRPLSSAEARALPMPARLELVRAFQRWLLSRPRTPLRRDGEDVCTCGHYRRTHDEASGKCRFGSLRNTVPTLAAVGRRKPECGCLAFVSSAEGDA
jgi:hypothetical protein